MTLDELIRGLCLKAIQQATTQNGAAKLLGISPNTLKKYLKQYNIQNPYTPRAILSTAKRHNHQNPGDSATNALSPTT